MTLVIDLGAVNTVAMLDGRLVTVDGVPWLPSVVHEGVVGADAVALAGARVARDLKARLDQGEVRTLFARVLAAARDQGGVLGDVVVTHPADWPPERVAVLVSAAGTWARALPEPVAVAALHGAGTALVVDAGGGTWDVSAVRGPSVLATAALPFGGNDVDRLVVERVRPSLRGPADDCVLLESARTGKELLSRHETTEIVLPDHRAVRLDRAEFDRLVAADVDRLARLAAEVGARAGATRVLLVGGSSRIPLLVRRLAEVTGLPVITDPEPETAVVRGAQLLSRPAVLEDPLAAPAGAGTPPEPPAQAPPPAPAPPPRPTPPAPPPRRAPARKPLAFALLLLLVAAVAVVAGGKEATDGRPVAVVLPPPLPEATIPPAVAGNEVVNAEIATFTSGALGEAVEYRYPGGHTFAVTFTGVETAVTAPQPYGEAPDGFRWLVLRLHIAHIQGPDFAHDPLESVAVLDDRGQWLRQPYGAGQVACTPGVPPPNRLPAASEADVCGVVSVPEATPVTAVLFGVRLPEAQAPLRFPVDVPAARDRAAPMRTVGTLGGEAVTVDGLRARVDLVNTPSGYLDRQVPAPGHRLVVVRVAITATGQRHLTVVLRDDRGAFLAGRIERLRGCPVLPGPLAPETPVYGCRVFEVAADTPVTAVTFVGRGPDTTRWPTWRG